MSAIRNQLLIDDVVDRQGRRLERIVHGVAREVVSIGSQFGEDGILAQLLPEPTGRYVDIGAAHPTICSNTWQFYQRGWRGLLIEPRPDCWYNLLRERPLDLLSPLAAGSAEGLARLRLAGSVSSLVGEWAPSHGDLVVEMAPLAAILETYGLAKTPCDLLSIDVEGYESEVLAGINWKAFRPRCVVIEYRLYDPDKPGADATATWESILTAAGYRYYAATVLNKVYVLPGECRE